MFRGMELTIASRTFSRVSKMKKIPSINTAAKASCHV